MSDGPRLYYPGCRAVLQVDLESFGDDDDVTRIVVPILPKKATIHRNSYRQADSYELVFEAGDLPFDPRIIRAGDAEVYLFQADSLATAPRAMSRTEPLSDADQGGNRPRSPSETLALDVGTMPKERFTVGRKPMVAGLFDSADLELSNDGKWVTISGQDYTAHLASIQWKPDANGIARRIPTGKRIDLLITDLLAEADPTGKLQVEVRGIDVTNLPIVGASEVGGNRRGIAVEQQTSYWDVIYKIAERYALIAFVDGLDVVLTRPKTINDSDTTTVKRLAWGKNLEHLRLERKFGREQTPTIVVQGYDEKTKQTISVEYPSDTINYDKPLKAKGTHKEARTTEKIKAKAATKGKQSTTLRKRDEYQVVQAYGITDRAVLRQMAENRYHLIGKGERKVIAKTRDLKDMRDSDMLDLTAGDAAVIDFDEFDRALLQNSGVPDEVKIQKLVLRGFNRAVAEVVVQRFSQLEALDRPLRVKEATYEFDSDDGIDIELELQDFIVVDGLRPGTGARGTPAVQSARDTRIDRDGNRVGRSQQEVEAAARRFDGS